MVGPPRDTGGSRRVRECEGLTGVKNPYINGKRTWTNLLPYPRPNNPPRYPSRVQGQVEHRGSGREKVEGPPRGSTTGVLVWGMSDHSVGVPTSRLGTTPAEWKTNIYEVVRGPDPTDAIPHCPTSDRLSYWSLPQRKKENLNTDVDSRMTLTSKPQVDSPSPETRRSRLLHSNRRLRIPRPGPRVSCVVTLDLYVPLSDVESSR